MSTLNIIRDLIEQIISTIIFNDDKIKYPLIRIQDKSDTVGDNDNDDDDEDSKSINNIDYLNNTVCVHYDKHSGTNDINNINEIEELDEIQTIQSSIYVSNNPEYLLLKTLIHDIILKIEYKEIIFNNVISNTKYHYVSNSVRLFLIEQGFIECNPHKFILDKNCLFSSDFKHYLLLECELMQNKYKSGFFVFYENNCEFIVRTENELIFLIQQLLIYLSYDKNNTCNLKNYKYLSSKTNQKILNINNYLREKIYNKFGAILILNEFPLYLNESILVDKNENYYKKSCVFLSGLETIIGCNLSNDKLTVFNHIKNNKINDVLTPYAYFLNVIFQYEWKERIYIKLNIENLIKSMDYESLIPDLFL
jgi:hypothetical protein